MNMTLWSPIKTLTKKTIFYSCACALFLLQIKIMLNDLTTKRLQLLQTGLETIQRQVNPLPPMVACDQPFNTIDILSPDDHRITMTEQPHDENITIPLSSPTEIKPTAWPSKPNDIKPLIVRLNHFMQTRKPSTSSAY